ncbi:EPIDERMAL PATTERNING FACTOR-like protein 8 [Vicia villosa]|uniref:EPIDERMAL PATTERNING FACTOR-like protein 8 n=1 Tax=Vicia villosa TaxID=3911 RepID=UPI00273AF6B0|nr:EPIDERMAL PATTERNING FACTOR-like protein 8 [Vicia villosa]
MSPSRIFNAAITTSFIFSLIVLLPRSGGSVLCDESDLEERKVVIGSKPPECVNKCMKCRPCMATVVVNDHDHHQRKKGFKLDSSHEENDSYYLLSWKCRCGNKLFQP